MRTVIVYESMFGNTRQIADAIGEGLSSAGEVTVVPVGAASQDVIGAADLVVVGGPTHMHGMSHANSRKGAVSAAAKPGSSVTLEPGADGPGVREWLAGPVTPTGVAAAFDTRLTGLAPLTGHASKGITSLLRRKGLKIAADPASFLVTTANELQPGELDRARDWGAALAAKVLPAQTAAAGTRRRPG